MRKDSKLSINLILSSLIVGVVIAVIDIIFEISLATLLFSGSEGEFVSRGIGLLLFGAMVVGLIVALTSSLPGMIAVPQDTAIAILVLITTAITTAMAGSPVDEIYLTILTAIVLTSLAAGIFLLITGQLRLSRLVRYIPYPVIGGFLAGTGWVIFWGGLTVLMGTPPSLVNLSGLFQSDMLALWLPALIFALVLLFALRLSRHPLVLPALVVVATALFFLWMAMSGTSVEQAQANGWLLGPFTEQALWQPYPLSAIRSVNWSVIFEQSLQIGAVLIVSVLALLLNTSGLEMTTRRNIDLDRELRSAGFANLVAALGGSPVGYQTLSFSAMAQRMGASTRLVGVFMAIVFAIVLFAGATLLSFFPKIVLGGVLLYIGLSFLVDWVYDAWFKLPRSDYFLVLLILVIVAAVGFLEGVAVGIGIALFIFVFNYSRTDIVKHTLSGESYHSSVDRPAYQRDYLRQYGGAILIMQLQGYYFFGSAYHLLDRIKRRVDYQDTPPLRYLLLNFRLVTGFDSSAASIFARIKQMAETENFVLVFTNISSEFKKTLSRADIIVKDDQATRLHESLDYGLEECENRLLDGAGLPLIEEGVNLQAQLKNVLSDSAKIDRLMIYLERRVIEEGVYLMRQGESSDSMYFIESGMLSIRLEMEGGRHTRIGKIYGGTTVGEMGLYLGRDRTASVVASEPSTVYRLSADAFQAMQHDDPQIAAALHQWIAKLLTERLTENVDTLRSLLD